jgi:hypothetical protein
MKTSKTHAWNSCRIHFPAGRWWMRRQTRSTSVAGPDLTPGWQIPDFVRVISSLPLNHTCDLKWTWIAARSLFTTRGKTSRCKEDQIIRGNGQSVIISIIRYICLKKNQNRLCEKPVSGEYKHV